MRLKRWELAYKLNDPGGEDTASLGSYLTRSGAEAARTESIRWAFHHWRRHTDRNPASDRPTPDPQRWVVRKR